MKQFIHSKNESLTKDFFIKSNGINSLNIFDNQRSSVLYDEERGVWEGGGIYSLFVPSAFADDRDISTTESTSEKSINTTILDGNPSGNNINEQGSNSA